MRGQTLSIRNILLTTIGALTLLVTVIITQDIYVQWQKLTRIEALKQATLLSDQLFNADEKLSVERDIAFSMLHASDKEILDNLRPRLESSRQEVDQTLQSTLRALEQYNFPEFTDPLQKSESQFAALQGLRQRIDTDIALPMANRDAALSQLWFKDATALIRQTQDVWMTFIKHYTDVDPYVVLHMQFKYFLGIIMEYSGRERSLIGRLIAENIDPTVQEQVQLLQWQSAVELGWRTSETLAAQGGLSPAIDPYIKDARSHYFTVYDMVRDIFYVPGAKHGASYPISVEFWLDLASQTTDSLYALKDATLKQTQNYVETLETQARQSIIYHLILLFLALSLCLYSFRVVLYRVVRPIKAIVEALLNATEGKAVAIEPPTYSRQDEIGKLAHVLHVFQQNIEEIRRTSDALSESEKKLQQSQKMEAIGNLTGGMAHDFNNLLGIIIGNLDLLLEKQKDDGEAKQLSQSAIDAALRGADLTRRLLAFARKQPLQSQRVNVNELISEITKLLSRTLGENVEISLNLMTNIWPVVVDPVQLESALTNLATNARDAMGRGGKLMIVTENSHLDADYVSQHPDAVSGDYVMILVSDTGSGMPSEIINRIFEPFFTTKARDKGTGLGLSMVFGFIKQSGGHINVYSEVGAGTTFRLYLPRATEAAAATTQGPAPLVVKGGHETILVVEDNEAMRRLVTRQLSELGYHVLEAENAASALELLTTGNKIDLLFTDVVMPGKLNGLELAQQAMARWPSLKVVLTSGFPENKLNDQEGLKTGGLRLLSKPYRKEELARIIRGTLEGNRS